MLKFVVLYALVPYALAADPRIDPDDSGRVVGGGNVPNAGSCSSATVNNFPFIASLRTPAASHFCAGSILNSVNILTVASCVIGRSSASTFVVVGSSLLHPVGPHGVPSKFIIHADYNSNTVANDIAVIRLASALSIGGNIQQVTLYTGSVAAVAATLIGWGTTSTGASSNQLQQLAATTITQANCQSRWGSLVTAAHICAQTCLNNAACGADLGSPLVLTSNRAQIGIASMKRPGSCAIELPDVLTRISAYIAWITNAVNL